ncbi:MAG: hypothetical protein D6706_13605 [Chloroflexi bacterium]|nr:MAG: hypothetical protein D6706_13605 [Chloroflexota bacterium]
MATSRGELLRRLNEVRAQIRAGIDVQRNRQRERYLVGRLAELEGEKGKGGKGKKGEKDGS